VSATLPLLFRQAWAEQLRRQFAGLLVRASLLEALRAFQNPLYAPPAAELPGSTLETRRAVRRLAREWRELRGLLTWLAEEEGLELRPGAGPAAIRSWSDPLALSRGAVALDPGGLGPRLALAGQLLALGRGEEALAWLLREPAVPAAGELPARWHRNRAEAFRLAGEGERAVQESRRAALAHPADPEGLLDHLCIALTAGVRESWRAALDLALERLGPCPEDLARRLRRRLALPGSPVAAALAREREPARLLRQRVPLAFVSRGTPAGGLPEAPALAPQPRNHRLR